MSMPLQPCGGSLAAWKGNEEQEQVCAAAAAAAIDQDGVGLFGGSIRPKTDE